MKALPKVPLSAPSHCDNDFLVKPEPGLMSQEGLRLRESYTEQSLKSPIPPNTPVGPPC